VRPERQAPINQTHQSATMDLLADKLRKCCATVVGCSCCSHCWFNTACTTSTLPCQPPLRPPRTVHPNAEVRGRTLQSLDFKWKYGLIGPDELVVERRVLSALLRECRRRGWV